MKIKNDMFRSPFILIMIGISSFFFLLNYYAPLFADDYANSFLRGTSVKMSSIRDVFENSYLTYIGWTGRFTTSFFVYLFIYLGETFFNVVNAIFITSLLAIMIRISIPHQKIFPIKNNNIIYFLLITLVIAWYGLPAFGETILWTTGAIVYMWATLFSLVFLLPYVMLVRKECKLKDNILSMLYMGLLGFFVGGTLENIAPIIVLMLCCFFIVLRRFKYFIPRWFYSGFIGVLIGLPIMILSPGNSNRALVEGVEKSPGLSLDRIIFFIKHDLKTVFSEQIFIIFTVLLLLIIVIVQYKKKMIHQDSNFKVNVILVLIFLIGSLSSQGIMLMSPYFPVRSSFPGAVLLIIVGLLLFDLINLTSIKKNTKIMIAFLMLIILVNSMSVVLYQYSQLSRLSKERIDIVNSNIDKGNKEVILPKINVIHSPQYDQGSRHVFIRDITEDPKYWTNTIFASYFGLDSVSIDDIEKKATQSSLDSGSENIDYENAKSILPKKDFKLAKDVIIKDIKVTKSENKYYFIFELNSDVNYSKLNNKVLFIHAYLYEKDLKLFDSEAVKYGFINMDYAPNFKIMNGKVIGIKGVESKVVDFPKISIGIYDHQNGNEGNILEIPNVNLESLF